MSKHIHTWKKTQIKFEDGDKKVAAFCTRCSERMYLIGGKTHVHEWTALDASTYAKKKSMRLCAGCGEMREDPVG